MKNIFKISGLVLIVFLLVLSSCSPNSQEEKVETKSVASIEAGGFAEMNVSSSTQIILTDFTEDQGVLITYDDEQKNVSKDLSTEDIVITKNGYGMPVPHDNGNTSFSGGVFFPGNSGKIRIEKFSFDDDLEITQEEMECTTSNGHPKLYNSRGEMITDEFYRIDLTSGEYAGFNTDEVAIMQIIKGSTVDYSNPEYGFVENNKVNLSTAGNEIHGLVDLSKKKAITVFNTIEFKGGTDMLCKIALARPVELEAGATNNIASDINVYKVTTDGKSGNYVLEITTTSSSSNDYFNSDYHILLRNNARARFIDGENAGLRRYPNLVPITRTGNTITMWVGEVDASFIFDCYIDGEHDDYGTITLRTATEEELAWKDNNTLPEEGTKSFTLKANDSVSFLMTGLNGDYTFKIEADDSDMFYSVLLAYGNNNTKNSGTFGSDRGFVWSNPSFSDGCVILNLWNPRKNEIQADAEINITVEHKVHENIQYSAALGKYECLDDGCGMTFDAQEAGNMLNGKWSAEINGYAVTVNITNWGNVDMTARKKGVEKHYTATTSCNIDTMQIFLDFPAPLKKTYELKSFYYGHSITTTDGTVFYKLYE
ncbi:MAG: hypothetical protein K5634_02760 [Sphaerochaetaceae bacterium]|nr:hypothetical protein [Sphaerochaetaceae bacterium]